MLWYFKNDKCYEYPSNQELNNSLTQRFHNSVYENSNEMEIYYAYSYMKENNISDLTVVFPIRDLSVNYGNENDINLDFCQNNNIHCRYENRAGGCMVLFPGSVIFLDIYPTNNFLRQHNYVGDFTQWLKDKGIKATTNNNDLLIDNKKVIGTISQTLPAPYNNWIYFGAVISTNVDVELIDKICTKTMNKIPGSLAEYGITTEDIMNFTLQWFDNHRNESYMEKDE